MVDNSETKNSDQREMDADIKSDPKVPVIWFFVRRYRVLFLGTLLLMLVSSVLESISVVAFFPFFTAVLNQPDTDASGILGIALKVMNLLPNLSPIVAASVMLIGILIAKLLFNLARDCLIAYTNGRVLYSVRKEIFERYSSAEYLFILDKKQGDLIYNSIEAPSGVSGSFAAISSMMMAIFKIFAIMIILISILPLAALAVVVLGIGYYILIHKVSRQVSYRLGQDKAEANAQQFVIAGEFLAGFRQIISFNAVSPWVRRFEYQNQVHSRAVAKELAWSAIPRPIVEIAVVTIMLGLVLVVWVWGGSTGLEDTLPKAGIFGVSMVQLMAPIASFGQMRMSMMTILPNLQIAHAGLTRDRIDRVDGGQILDAFETEIRFDQMSFSYPGREPIFEDLNLVIDKGKVTALVGSSGSGKTTIVNLLLGLVKPAGGRISVDGLALGDLDKGVWLKKIGFVSQDPFIYHTSISENILLGRTGRSDEEVIKAAKIANAHDFISEHPGGYGAIVGDRGMRLSGGQQQRLSIARAILDDPEILIFDEATSSLDTISEGVVQESIESVSKDRTVIIIAHRLSTVKHADKIVVLDGGRVVEQGSHTELLGNGGQYSRLVANYR